MEFVQKGRILQDRVFFFVSVICFVLSPVFADVTLTQSTWTWISEGYEINDQYGLISHNSNQTIVHEEECFILENEYLQIKVVPDVGARVVSMIYKPTEHQELYTMPVSIPYGIGDGSFYHNWLMVIAGTFPSFPEPEHGKYWMDPWEYEIVKHNDDTVSIKMSKTDWIDAPHKAGKFIYGLTGIVCEYTVSLYSGKTYYQADVKLTNPTSQSHDYEYWTLTLYAPGSDPSDPMLTANAELFSLTHLCKIEGWSSYLGAEETNLGGDSYTFENLRWYKNWHDMGIVYGWEDANNALGPCWGIINHDDPHHEGLIRISANNNTITPGLKIWNWGFEQSYNKHEGTRMPFFELWGGTARRFWSPDNLEAGEEKSSTEYFTATVGCSTFTDANAEVLVSLSTDRDSYSGFSGSAWIELDFFRTDPREPVNVKISIEGGDGSYVIYDADETPDPETGNSLDVLLPLTNGTKTATSIEVTFFDKSGHELFYTRKSVSFENVDFSVVAVRPAAVGQYYSAVTGRDFGSLYTLDGRLVRALQCHDEYRNIPLPQGIYILRFANGVSQKYLRSGIR